MLRESHRDMPCSITKDLLQHECECCFKLQVTSPTHQKQGSGLPEPMHLCANKKEGGQSVSAASAASYACCGGDEWYNVKLDVCTAQSGALVCKSLVCISHVTEQTVRACVLSQHVCCGIMHSKTQAM
jgi:hypothetical protein